MPVDEYRATEAAAMTELADESMPVLADEVMARFRASEAAEEDTTRRILALYFRNPIEEESRGNFVAGKLVIWGVSKKEGNICIWLTERRF